MSTGCEFYADALADRASGRLDAERARRLERHLAGCDECRRALDVVEAVRATPVPVPDGLEARIRTAVHEAAGEARGPEPAAREAMDGPGPAIPAGRPRPRPRRGWAWGLPLAAAAALAVVWVGVGGPEGAEPDVAVSAAEETIEPFGVWPGADGMLAGDPLLSELTVEELEQLLEELES